MVATCFAIGVLTSLLNAQPSTQPRERASFVGAEVVERYDANGDWRAIPLKAFLNEEQTKQLAGCFPGLNDAPEPLSGRTTLERMRFQIKLLRKDGTAKSISISPSMNIWWDDVHVFALAAVNAEQIKLLVKNSKEDASFVPKSPVVRVELADRFDGYLNRRPKALQAVVTGDLASRLAGDFPELGLRSEAQFAAGAVPRFSLTFIRQDGTKNEVEVFEEIAAPWTWCEGRSYWVVNKRAAHGILMILGNPLYAVKEK